MQHIRNLTIAVFLTSGAAYAETVTVAMLGDSLTAGYGLPQGDGLVPQLQGWLDDRGVDVRLVNAGVSGDTSAGGLSRVDWTLTPDVDAMVVALGGNDYLRGLDPAVTRANLDGILAAGRSAGVDMLLVGLSAGGNFGADYKAAFDGNYSDLAMQYNIPLVPDIFSGIREAAPSRADQQAYLQADGIHPNKDGVALIVNVLGGAIRSLVADE